MEKSKSRKLNLLGGLRRTSRLTPTLKMVKKFLDDLPVDEARSVEFIADELGISFGGLQTNIKRLGEKYRYREGNAYGYGNPETVKLKKEGFYEIQTEPESE